ncbi:anti-silencing protein, putative [Entamoeba histolytica HM-1:IMSS-B]|uniref:Anti-silencing protein, putative n=6 Tax=Entamoeba histolytica TaxID=5759 RepID=C4LX08_ENTH1|nr:anti-silencing protein, putative [Entamoeba histolytica HM-1:IMSS]EMD44745.1 antisilencing protein, putative [Entamoeba histolytica KU27]EMH75650.1 anti-silencing protein, putative [Entamoeba histolytica HM-1:IMSS-B]EMS12136.1 anti-silencing protein [Entamoeba histolytica HM-3:IMSS]ENY65213.1 anti-silencing protein, putative [Entamoeba histolytica HM-1:IMSS-A]GAT93258.1 anti-silencing protein putative [Entamoeba histolytica]|eukprot:XP_652308.1 anti-silencing protein, putative [Entamoeba histolytica HM-1:IMSS]
MASLTKINSLFPNPSTMNDGYSFEIYINVSEQLQEDIGIKVIYVGSSFSNEYDQILEDIAVGPLSVGLNKFTITTGPIDMSKLPDDEILGNTLILISASYKDKEFCRIGYYVNNEFEGIDPTIDVVKREMLVPEKITRTLSEPRVTLFPCYWDKEEHIEMIEEKPEELGRVISFSADGTIQSNETENDNQMEEIQLNPEIKNQIRSALGVDGLMKKQKNMDEDDSEDEMEPMEQ